MFRTEKIRRIEKRLIEISTELKGLSKKTLKYELLIAEQSELIAKKNNELERQHGAFLINEIISCK